jgi:hypothetical protein
MTTDGNGDQLDAARTPAFTRRMIAAQITKLTDAANSGVKEAGIAKETAILTALSSELLAVTQRDATKDLVSAIEGFTTATETSSRDMATWTKRAAIAGWAAAAIGLIYAVLLGVDLWLKVKGG